MYYTSLINY